VGRTKLEETRERLGDLDAHIEIVQHDTRLISENALDIIDQYDIVADGTDNFPTRYLVNDACVITGTPNVYASIFRFEGQVSIFGAPGGPCYRCLYEEPPPPGLVPSCAEGGVLGVLPGLVGTLQATEVIKYLADIGEPLVGRLLVINALNMNFRELTLRRNPGCPVCGDDPSVTELIDYEQFCGITPSNGQTSDDMTENRIPEITVTELKQKLESDNPPFVLDVRKPHEYEIANLDGTLIPLDQLEDRLEELEEYRNEEVVVHCRSGQRSAEAVEKLQQAGFEYPVNLKGGILAWSEEIDPSVPQY
jgi:adenylyltransferase/sulfurtransferase